MGTALGKTRTALNLVMNWVGVEVNQGRLTYHGIKYLSPMGWPSLGPAVTHFLLSLSGELWRKWSI